MTTRWFFRITSGLAWTFSSFGRPCALLRLPQVLVVALILAAVGFSGGCSSWSSSAPPKKQSPLPYNPWIKPAKKENKTNWLSSLFATKKEKPRNPSDWIGQERPGP
ncbi:MAG: hypothetical protein JXB10_03680 [Pirellulales bacterium]|nr:hypothetical protein [Pirellulales bacterium]